jgi:hypothetical protein
MLEPPILLVKVFSLILSSDELISLGSFNGALTEVAGGSSILVSSLQIKSSTKVVTVIPHFDALVSR